MDFSKAWSQRSLQWKTFFQWLQHCIFLGLWKFVPFFPGIGFTLSGLFCWEQVHSFFYIYIYSIIKDLWILNFVEWCLCFEESSCFFSCSSIILHLKCKCSFPAHGRGVTTRSSSRSLPVHTILWSVSVLCWQFWNALLFDIDFTSSFILLSCMKNLVSQIG